MIGIQYGLCGLVFLFFGFCLMMLMRWQLAYPGQALPVIGKFLPHIFGAGSMPDGKMTADFYNSLGAMHGTIMIFAGVVPLAFAAFGNFVVPLQIGAPDMTFPKVNAASFWAFCGWRSDHDDQFLRARRRGQERLDFLHAAGRYFENRGAGFDPVFNGQTLWLIGFIFLITSSLLGAVNFITTIIQLRAKGLTWMRLPFFVWAQFVTAFLLLLAFPPLEAAIIMQLMDRVADTSFFLPSGLVVNGAQVQISGGGSPLLWQHLFWFLGHPEVYVLILPGVGIVAEILANNSRKPLWGYKSLVFSVLVIGFLSFIVWAHHMWLTGMGTAVSAFFQTTTLLISIPSVIILSAFFISLWGGSIRFNVPMLFVHRIPADVWNWRPDRHSAGLQQRRPLSARHLLRHRAFPLHRGAGNDLRALCRHLLLVPESDRSKDERVLGQSALLADAYLYERHFSAHVLAGDGRNASALV